MKRKIYANLLDWQKNNIKKPYMLVGARQTGKTYIINEFCQNEFADYIYLNLELAEDVKKIFDETINPEEIIKNLEIYLNREIDIEKTVIFIDEIQVSERAICSLKYFCESKKNYKIITAGSLLGVKINRFKSSFPVGKVWIEYLYPMDFEEFLWALKEEKLVDLIKEKYQSMTPMSTVIHQKALKLYQDYLCIGGMPAAVIHYLECGCTLTKFNDNILNMIILSYLADMSKYTENIEAIRNNKIYNAIPRELGRENKKFKYSLVEKSARAREYDSALEWLLSSNMLIKCQGVKFPQSPLKGYSSPNFKIYLNDIGLLRVLAKISINEIITGKNELYKGVLCENYVAFNLYCKHQELFYWHQDNLYEVDFLLNIDGDIIPVEVKSKDNTISKSLNYYIAKYHPKYSIKISSKNFGEVNGLKSIPLYASFLL